MTTPATFTTRVTFDHVRNTAAGFTSANPVLGYGVTGLETDTGKIKLGDGVTAWASLPYSGGGPVEWANVQGKPSTFAPSAHQHPISDVTGLQAALDGKATPADVTAAVSAVIDSAPASLDTLNELAAALGDDANFASTVTNALAAKAPLASPTFTGTVSGVTKAMVGLGNVDNTSDANKPVSTAQAAADSAVASAAASDATTKANAAQAAAVQRANHTGTQAISTVDGLQAALDGKQASGSYAAASHSHVISDVTGLQTALDGKQAAGSYAAATHASQHQTGGSDAIPNVVTSPSQLTADQNDYAIGSGDIFQVSASAARNITGIVAGTNGQAILLVNTGSFAITLKHESASSTAANRLTVPWAGDYVMSANGGAALLVYFTATNRWRVV